MTEQTTDPLADAIEAAIWAGYPDTEPSDVGLVLANPRRIAAAAASTARAVSSAVPAPATDRATLDLAKRVTRAIHAKTPPADRPQEYRVGWEEALDAAIDAARAVLAVLPAPTDQAAADSVRALHQPMQRGPFTICAHCSGWDGEWRCLGVVTNYPCPTVRAMDGEPAREAQQDPTQDGCTCGHPADEHSVYGCEDDCACEWMPKRKPVPAKLPPMDPMHILGIDADAAVARPGQPDTEA